jgi:hypothetical protein
MTLPDKAGRRGKVLAFDSTTGNPVAGPSLDSMVTVIEQSAFINAVGENIDDVIAVADNEANIDTVAGVSSAVTTVATNISNVNTVASDLNEDVSEINTVAVNIANVNTVGNNIGNVNTVGGISANVTTVAGISSNVTTVAGISSAVTGVNAISSAVTGVDANATDISAVNANKTNIDTVAGISANVTTVAGISANVTSVAGNSTNINTVATDISNVNSVGGNIANVNSVAGNATNINAVNANATNINAVAGINANVTTVAGISANVTTVAGISANVTSVAGNASNINQVASDTVAINSASANATSAAASALSASNSATSASASAAAASAVALGNEPVRHSVRPSLLLDFANTKTLDPRITFTRASTATYYDGKTVAKAEENLFTRSEEFNEAVWTKSNTTVTANATTAPDGTTTADAIVETTTASTFHNIRQSVTTPSGQAITFSFYAKENTRRYAWFGVFSNTGAYGAGTVFRDSIIDLQTGLETGTTAGTLTYTFSSSSVGDGWYRYVIVLQATTGSGTVFGSIGPAESSSSYASYTGAVDKNIYAWGAQLEQRSSVTAYTATTTAPITNYIPALQTAASGVARFEHNPVTGESLGLEIEEQRTNLLTYSETFQSPWGTDRASYSTVGVVPPSGSGISVKLVEDTTASNTHNGIFSPALADNTTYTFYVYLKAAERTFAALRTIIKNGTQPVTIFNLSNGTVHSTNALHTSSITSVGNGWYRCAVAYGSSSGATSPQVAIQLANSTPNTTYTGDGYSGIYIWGAQLEAGAFATSYIPTVASQVTRSSDAASMTGSNFSSWYRADEGTIYTEAQTSQLSITPNLWRISDGTVNNRIQATMADSRMLFISTNGTTQVDLDVGTYAVNTFAKQASAYKVNDIAVSLNAGTVGTDTSALIPVVDRISIGGDVAMTGTIRKFAFYGKKLSNAELQGLTTV